MLRRAVQLLLCFSLLLVSGPLAPCKLEHALTKWSVKNIFQESSGSTVKGAALSWRGAGDPDSDCDGDASCWCSVHMSTHDSAGASIDCPAVVALLTPATCCLMPVRAEASRPASYALEPPVSAGARTFPLLI